MATNPPRNYEKLDSTEIQEICEVHRDVLAIDAAFPTATPRGWESAQMNGGVPVGYEHLFKCNGAKTIELRAACTIDTSTTKSLAYQLWGWPYSRQTADSKVVHYGAGVLIESTTVQLSGHEISGQNPFTGESTLPTYTSWFLADGETKVYPAGASNNIALYPTVVANAAGFEMRKLYDVQGMGLLFAAISAIHASSRTLVALRRVS